jgi:hypothetical protein
MEAVDPSRPAPHPSVPPPTVTSPVSPVTPGPRIPEDAFLAEATVDAWTRTGAATRTGGLLTLSDGRRYALRDALRVIGRRNGDTDPYGLTGRAEPIREFLRRGATVAPDALRLGPAVYDVEYGFLAAAAG